MIEILLFVVDGAQSVPHQKTDVIKDNIDFLTFSAHWGQDQQE